MRFGRIFLSRTTSIACRTSVKARPLPRFMASTAPAVSPVPDEASFGPLVAVAQLTATNDHAQNFRDAETCARAAFAAGCSLLALPECFSFIGASAEETIAQARQNTTQSLRHAKTPRHTRLNVEPVSQRMFL